MITREKIEATIAFQELEKIRKIVVGKKVNVDYLKRNFVVAKTIGFEAWKKQCGSSAINIKIIQELLN
jgi:ribosomal protein S19E (S16A)